MTALDLGAFQKWVGSLLLHPKHHKYKVFLSVKGPKAGYSQQNKLVWILCPIKVINLPQIPPLCAEEKQAVLLEGAFSRRKK